MIEVIMFGYDKVEWVGGGVIVVRIVKCEMIVLNIFFIFEIILCVGCFFDIYCVIWFLLSFLVVFLFFGLFLLLYWFIFFLRVWIVLVLFFLFFLLVFIYIVSDCVVGDNDLGRCKFIWIGEVGFVVLDFVGDVFFVLVEFLYIVRDDGFVVSWIYVVCLVVLFFLVGCKVEWLELLGR